MATKTRVSRLESEIDKCRSFSNWTKVFELSKQIPKKGPGIESLATLLQCESKLERYLDENPANEKNVSKAREELASIQSDLSHVIDGSYVKGDLQIEATLLVCKILYAMGEYSKALAKYGQLNLDSISLQNATDRRLQLIGEAYAIEGLCLEKLPPESTSKYKIAEREEKIIKCFEKSGDISLLQLQSRQNKGDAALSVALKSGWNAPVLDTVSVGPLVETAIQRSPISYIRNGELHKGIGRFRDLLNVVETRAFQSLRQTLARQLAEVLLRGVCRSTYESVNCDDYVPKQQNGPQAKKYTGSGLFCPLDQCEETLLLLLISESIACRDALLNRSEDMQKEREHTFHSATAVYDLLTLALVRYSQYDMLSDTFDRAMKFSFDEFHIWYQFALSLISAEKYARAYLVLKECLRLEPRNAVVLLQAAKLCFEQLGHTEDGIEHCQVALDLEENPMLSRCHLFLGVGYGLRERETRLKQERQENQRKALQAFRRAAELDSNDYLAQFHLARQLAICRQIGDALKHVRAALLLNAEHVYSQHLLALLLSAQKQNEAALQLVESSLEEYPDNFSLLITKSQLEENVYGVEAALHSCRKMLLLWKKVFEPTLDNEVRGTGLINRIASDHRSLVQLNFSDFNDRDSGSVRAESMAASKIEQTLSESASTLGSYLIVRKGPHESWNVQTQIWLNLGEMYLRMGLLEAAHACISEAAFIQPLSYTLCYMRGRLHEAKGELEEAKQSYQNAVSINPVHAKSLQHLGGVLHKLGHLRMAEKVLREGVNSDSTCSGMWAGLGRVLQELGQSDTAAECHMTAVMLDNTDPVVPFNAIPFVLS